MQGKIQPAVKREGADDNDDNAAQADSDQQLHQCKACARSGASPMA